MAYPFSDLLKPIKTAFSGMVSPAFPNATAPVAPAIPTTLPSNPATPKPAIPTVSAPAPTPPVVPPIPTTSGQHIVASGDTLSAIASKNNISLTQLLNLNPQFRANPNLIKPGQSISLSGNSATPPAPASPILPTTTTPPAGTITTPSGVTVNPATGGIVTPLAIPETTAGANPPTPPVPPTPSNPLFTNPEYEKAKSEYEKALPLTPEEIANQEAINALDASIRTGITGEADRPIPLQFITGRQKAIEERGLALEAPLQARAALMQAKRLASLEASKFKLEQESGKLGALRADEKATRAETESARRFGIEQSGFAGTRALAEKKFAEDTRQFGLDYAIKQREVGVKERQDTITEDKSKITPEKVQDLQDKIKNIQTLIDDPYLETAVGPNAFARTSFSTGFTGGRQNFVAGVKQLTSRETLDILINLKSKGGTLGALSDQERIMLQNAATKIGNWEMKTDGVGNGFYNVDEGSFKKELNTLKLLAERALKNAEVSTQNIITAPDGSQVIITD